jgi:hypothetical protein
MSDVPHLLSNGSGCDEEVVRCVFAQPLFHHLPCPLQVDDGVDHDIGDVDSLWSQLTSDGFRQYLLRDLGRRKAREVVGNRGQVL